MTNFAFDNTLPSIRLWLLISAGFFLLFAGIFLSSESTYIAIGAEDGVVENISAAFYAIAGGALIWTGIFGKTVESRGLLTTLLGLFFVFVAGEEISWGQRILGFRVPESIADLNTQAELNFHNLIVFDKNASWLNQHTLLNVFVLINGVIFPLLYHLHTGARYILNRLRFPVAPLSSVPVFVLALLYGQSVAKVWPHWAHTEYKEVLFSLGFLIFGISHYKDANRQLLVLRGDLGN